MSGVIKKSNLDLVINLGLDPNDYRGWRRKFKHLRSNAKLRGVECLLSFSNYLQLASEAGLTDPDQIGKGSGKYQMGRYTDSGDYAIGTCRFITVEQNQAEKLINGGVTRQADSIRGRTAENNESVRRGAKAREGRTKESHEYLRISGEKRKGRTAQTHECVARMVQKKTGRTSATDPGIRSMVEKRTGRTKHTHEYLAEAGRKIARSFVAFNPYGIRHTGSNVTEFAKTHGLNQSELSKVFRGEVRQHKGWTGHYTD